MPENLALLRLICLSQERRDAFAIAKAAHKMGRAKGDAEGYERGLRDHDALADVVRQPAPPDCEAART